MSFSHEKHAAEAQHRVCFTSRCRREERTSQAPFSPCPLPALSPQKLSSGCLQQLVEGAAISAIAANLQAAVQHPEGVLSAHSSHQLPFTAAHACRHQWHCYKQKSPKISQRNLNKSLWVSERSYSLKVHVKAATHPSGLAMCIQLEDTGKKQLEFSTHEQDYHLLPKSVFPAGRPMKRGYSQYRKEKNSPTKAASSPKAQGCRAWLLKDINITKHRSTRKLQAYCQEKWWMDG